MTKLHKDILRYIILGILSYFAIKSTYDIIDFAFIKPDMSTQIVSLLGAINASILGTWGFVVKKFFETKVGD